MPMEEDLEVVDSDEDSLEGGGRGRRIGRRGRSGGQDEDEAGDDGLGSEATMENRGDDSELKEIIKSNSKMRDLSEDGWNAEATVATGLAGNRFSGQGGGFSSSSFGSQAVSAPVQTTQAPMKQAQPSSFNSAEPNSQQYDHNLNVQKGFGSMSGQNGNIASSFVPQTSFGNAQPSGFFEANRSGFGENAPRMVDPKKKLSHGASNPANNSFGSQARDEFGAVNNKFGSGFGTTTSQVNNSFNKPSNTFNTVKEVPPANAPPSSGFGSIANQQFGGAHKESPAAQGGSFGSAGFGSTGAGFGSSSGGFSSGFAAASFGAAGRQSFEKPEGGNKGYFNCGSMDHRKSDCTAPPKERERPAPDKPCPFCKERGHWKSQCSQNPDKDKCSNCKEEEHFASSCPQPHKCLNCGEDGHYSRECSQPKKERGPLTCYNCQQIGYHANECTEPAKPREDGSKPPSTFVPEDDTEESLFKSSVGEGGMFKRLFDASTTVTSGGIGELNPTVIEKIESFDELRLGDRITENLKHCGYTRPTPVQQHTMPLIQQGFDVVACAQTGSGKTAAYLLPILSKLTETQDYASPMEGGGICYPRAVVIVPTRELAVQVYNETRKYAYGTLITCKAVYGGTAVGYQKDELRKGATIVAATLGRLKHFVEDGTISLDKLRFFVFDEVDRLLEQDTEQIIVSIHNKIDNKELVQGIMFSATFPNEVQSQATILLKPNYKMVTVDAIGTANKCIQQDIECVDPKEKKDKLLALLDIDKDKYSIDPNSTIYQQKILIFVSKKGFADTLASIVSQSGLPATTIHADRQQNERSEAMKDFIYGRKAVMIATAVAERGLDIRGVDHVINYDLPDDIHQYVHRIGRTGRRGNPGRATSFYSTEKDNRLAEGLMSCLIAAEQVVPDWLSQEVAHAAPSSGFGAAPGTAVAAAADDDW